MAQQMKHNNGLGDYVSVDTDFVDDLEHYALDRIRVRIRFQDHSNTIDEMNGLIGEVFTENHQEFLKMADGRKIRLDQIIEAVPH